MFVIVVDFHHQAPALLYFFTGYGFFLRMSLMATQKKITSRTPPQKIQSAVLKPNMLNSS